MNLITYPKVPATTGPPHFISITKNVRNQAWTEVSCQVHRITGKPTPAGTKTEDKEEESEGHQVARASLGIRQSKDDKLEDAAGDELGPEHVSPVEELGRICAEDSCRR